MVTTRTSAEARARAVEALHLVEHGERSSLDGLRDAICTYLTLLRREGISKPDALEQIRALVTTPTSNERTWLLPAAREALTDLATHWCTEQYARE